ncbi:MAG: hypothetical protein NTV94_10620 [Planctomycetota bacterium]|nr:hypothetical protein [Planctomycetota bacterium]
MSRNLFASASALALVCFLGACAAHERSEAQCQERKPGTITSVNEFCPVQIADTVDPAIVVEWKGQKVGLCCDNCKPTWAAMSAQDKDKALAIAVAKGKIKN